MESESDEKSGVKSDENSRGKSDEIREEEREDR